MKEEEREDDKGFEKREEEIEVSEMRRRRKQRKNCRKEGKTKEERIERRME